MYFLSNGWRSNMVPSLSGCCTPQQDDGPPRWERGLCTTITSLIPLIGGLSGGGIRTQVQETGATDFAGSGPVGDAQREVRDPTNGALWHRLRGLSASSQAVLSRETI